MRKRAWAIWLLPLWFAVCGSSLKANMVYPLKVFTTEGLYHDSPDLNLYIKVSDGEPNQVEFSFYNESSIDSCIARIYLDDDYESLLGIANIEGLGVSFSQPVAPGNLPGAKLLDPAFETTSEFSIDADPPPPKNGINPGEWGVITFDLINDTTLEDVISGLNTNILRVGTHVINLPDGSSVSAVTIPELGTLMLLGTAGLWVFTRKRRSARMASRLKQAMRQMLLCLF